jgi:hypothetical protein
MMMVLPTFHQHSANYQRMGLLNMSTIQELAKQDFFGPTSKLIKSCETPLCKACQHAKQHTSPITPNTATGIIDALHLHPGDCISGDQIESSSPGLIPTYRGTPVNTRYHASILFVYFASRFLYFMPHISTGASEAINAKHSFELLASQHNMLIKCYHTDNGLFASTAFHNSCKQQNQ